MYPKLVVFDIDGTLLPNTTIARHMAAHLGSLALIDQMEAAWEIHEMDHEEFSVRSAAAYAGHDLKSMARVAEGMPVIAGAARTIQALRATGSLVILATVSMAFAARVLAEKLGCDHARGTELEIMDDVFTGKVARFNNEAAKAQFVEDFANDHGIAMQNIAAIGDSRSDIPLFAKTGRTVALNASPAAIDAAQSAIVTRDLTDILPLLRV